jgi:hypothetical protein
LVIVDRQTGEIMLFESVEDAEFAIEPPDAASNYYYGFDAEGRNLTISEVSRQRGLGVPPFGWTESWTEVRVDQDTGKDVQGAREVLRRYLEELVEPSRRLSASECRQMSLEALIDAAEQVCA